MVRLLHRRHWDRYRRELSFNPTMVRLLRLQAGWSTQPLWRFNPTMVRLLRKVGRRNAADFPCFNPTMVRLLLVIIRRFPQKFAGFNPTMVRLLRAILSTDGNPPTKFQSHNGAIAARKRRSVSLARR